jgi:hypothetical protein
MAIYRGAGGAGDATGDSASEALLVRELAAEVEADAAAAAAAKTAAEAAQAAAELAETNAETAEANAETAEANAETAEANAEAAQAAAEAAQAAAETAQTAAELAETNAETAETNAETAATAAASSASAASTSASSASTSATNASNSATAAATSATNASNSATAAATSATNASNSATAAATSATNAANSVTAAQTAETNAETAETNAETAQAAAEAAQLAAETAETNAETAETNAAASASAAATSATNASNSASAASTSASNASTSASNASASEIAAAASAAAAAASYDSFDDRYLGAKNSAPTVDNDGNALIAGALYYNTGAVTPADKGMYVYDGSQWIAASAASTAILVVYKYTATSGQTTFSGNDDNSVALAYTAGSIIVTLNGVVLESGSEYTATSGTSVVLASGAATGDELNIHAFSTFDIANVYTQTQSDAKYALISNPTLNGNVTTTGLNFDSNTFVIDASNNRVGVNNASPSAPLDVVGSAFFGSSSTTSSYVARFYNQNSNLYIGVDNAAGSNTGVAYNTYFLGLNAYPMTFYTNSSERMRIDSSGNVGIGTSSPSQKLTVAGTYYQTGDTIRFKNSASNTSFLRAEENGSTAAYTYCTLDGRSTGYFSFSTNDAERMRIDSSGNVGIGTSSPASKLDVATGNMIVRSGNITGYDNATITANAVNTNGTVVDINSAGTVGVVKLSTNNAERMRIDSSGNLLVGTTSDSIDVAGVRSFPAGALGVTRNTPFYILYITNLQNTSGSFVEFRRGSTPVQVGSITYSGSSTSYNTSSDYRLKNTIAPMTGALAKVAALKPCTYKWNSDGSDGEGFIAHELAEVVPQCVTGEKDAVDADGNPKYQGIDTSFLVATLTAAIQELKAEVDALKAQINQ